MSGTTPDRPDPHGAGEEPRDRELATAFQILMENAFDAVMVLNAHGVILYVSPAIENLLGYDSETAMGHPALDFVHEDDREKARKMISGIIERGGRSEYFELRVPHRDGTLRIVEAVAQNFISHEYIDGVVLNYRDITDRRRTEDALRRSEARYATAFRSSPDSITISELPSWRLVEVNDGFVAVTGYERHEMIGKTPPEIGFWREAGARERYRAMLLEKGSLREHEVEFIDKHGNVLTCLISAELVEIEEVRYALAVTRDVTELKVAYEALRSTTDQLEKERQELREKNIALKQVLDHIEKDKAEFRHEMSAEIENLLSPVLRRMRAAADGLSQKHVDQIEEALRRVTHEDMDEYRNNLAKLTPREMDVCELIRKGLSSKEIAESLGVSDQTVHKHRNTIRRKLQLHNKSINLAAYLRSR